MLLVGWWVNGCVFVAASMKCWMERRRNGAECGFVCVCPRVCAC